MRKASGKRQGGMEKEELGTLKERGDGKMVGVEERTRRKVSEAGQEKEQKVGDGKYRRGGGSQGGRAVQER